MSAKLSKLAGGQKKTVSIPVQPDSHEAATRDTPVHRFVAELRQSTGVPYLTTAEVAEELGVSSPWIRKVQRQGTLGVPSMVARLGQIRIYLYTPEDVAVIRRYLDERVTVYQNTPGQSGRVQTWQDVISNRDRNTPHEDQPKQRADSAPEPAATGG